MPARIAKPSTPHHSEKPHLTRPHTTMAHVGGAKSKKSMKHGSKKHGSKKTKKAKMPEGMAWCPTCKKGVKMVNPVKVPMKMAGGKTRERYSATDVHGHKVSRII